VRAKEVLSSSRSRCFPSLEALPAKHRPALSRTERNGGFPAALGTVGGCLHLVVSSRIPAFLAFALARFAALGLVPEVLVGEKLLLTRSEHEICITIHALEYSILKL